MTSLILTIYAGFTHAFETDHLLAVSSIVTKRDRISHAVKDGMYWGLGHTSTILLIGLLMLVLRMQIEEHAFAWFEAGVGLALILLALFRLWRFYTREQKRTHPHPHPNKNAFGLAYSVGLVHGLAGSGSLVVLVMSQVQSNLEGMTYLLIFGLGSMVGMLVAASLFSVPFTRQMFHSSRLQHVLILVSCGLCLFYGVKIIYENLLA